MKKNIIRPPMTVNRKIKFKNAKFEICEIEEGSKLDNFPDMEVVKVLIGNKSFNILLYSYTFKNVKNRRVSQTTIKIECDSSWQIEVDLSINGYDKIIIVVDNELVSGYVKTDDISKIFT